MPTGGHLVLSRMRSIKPTLRSLSLDRRTQGDRASHGARKHFPENQGSPMKIIRLIFSYVGRKLIHLRFCSLRFFFLGGGRELYTSTKKTWICKGRVWSFSPTIFFNETYIKQTLALLFSCSTLKAHLIF